MKKQSLEVLEQEEEERRPKNKASDESSSGMERAVRSTKREIRKAFGDDRQPKAKVTLSA